jgi:LysR family transcriptional regulator, transcriptional activator of nhaA
LRRSLELWFQQRQIRPRVVAEFEDAALMNVMAVDEKGLAPIPTVVAEEAITRHRLQRIGTTEECKEQFYAITAERRIVHPAAVAITENAQLRLFAHDG